MVNKSTTYYFRVVLIFFLSFLFSIFLFWLFLYLAKKSKFLLKRYSFSDVAGFVSKCLLIVLYSTLKYSAANPKPGKLFIKSNLCEL